MSGAERHTKVLNNVWAHQVFTCLVCGDTMRVIDTKMLADKQRKFSVFIFFLSHSLAETELTAMLHLREINNARIKKRAKSLSLTKL